MVQSTGNEPSAVDLLRLISRRGVSDLHLEADSPPVLRVDGDLEPQDMPALSATGLNSILEEIADEEQRQRLWEDRELDFAYSSDAGRFRVNASLQRGSIALAFRLVRDEIPSLAELGLPEVCGDLALMQRGLVLVTGPTGCGKSTTLAAMIDHINQRERRHIVTVEDPIEYIHHNKQCLLSQRELGPDTRSFATALTHALRQDPDVIMVGEMRDLETVSDALTAAETGHLVLATLHTPNAPQTVDRVVDIFPPHQQSQVRVQLAMALEAVLCQTLVPRQDRAGRVAAVEVMIATPAIRNLIREGKTHQLLNVIETGAQHGMRTLDQALVALCQSGVISSEAALSHCQNAEELRSLLGRRDGLAA